jgi:hypothetical protein
MAASLPVVSVTVDGIQFAYDGMATGIRLWCWSKVHGVSEVAVIADRQWLVGRSDVMGASDSDSGGPGGRLSVDSEADSDSSQY